MHKLHSIYPKHNKKQITHQSNKLCMLQTEKKYLKSIKAIYTTVKGEKLAMSIREENQQFHFVRSFSVVQIRVI